MSTKTLSIDQLGRRGEGIAHLDDARIYVPLALPGESVAVDIDGDRGNLLSILESSPDRIDPSCPYFGSCGGCQLQHIAPAAYLAFKRSLVETPLHRAGIEAPVAEPVSAHGAGRRRATLHARRNGAGYMRARSHEILPIDTCPILVPDLARAPKIARAAHAAVGDCDTSFTTTLTGIDLAIRTEKRARPEALVNLARRFDLARLSLNGDLVVQSRAPLVRMGRAEVELPPASFLQATEAAEATLARLVVEAFEGRKMVLDLFCGLGPFALRLAEQARVLAFDSDAAAIAALHKAIRNTPGLKPVEARRRDLFREPVTRFETATCDGAVFDPPRAGAAAQARELAGMPLKVVVAVSCDPGTFARDAAILIAGGYTLEQVTPVDQFAYSTHIELVGVFKR